MKRKVVVMIGLLLSVATLTVYCFAGDNYMKIKSGTIKLKRFSEADYPYLAKILPGQAAMWKLYVDKESMSEARKQLSIFYGHIPFGPTSAMDEFFEKWSGEVGK